MNKRFAICLAAACLSLPWGATSHAQVMEEACATSDPEISKLFDATVYLVNLSFQQLTLNSDQTYALTPVGTYTNSPYGPLDPASAYYGTPQAPAGRSGVLIAGNTILTTAHQVPFDYTYFAYVFGLRAHDIGGVCHYPDLAHIPAQDVYLASTGSDGLYNGVVLNTHSATAVGDFVVITLNRPVLGRTPMAVRKTGFAAPQDRFAGVSFSQRLLPAKGDFNILHINESAPGGVQIANTSMLPGASGAPVYNLDAHVIETLDAYTNSCVAFYSEPNGFFLLQANCPGGYAAVNGPVTVISTLPGFHDADLIFRAAFE